MLDKPKHSGPVSDAGRHGRDLAPASSWRIQLDYWRKPFGRRDPLANLLSSLIDNAKIVVRDYASAPRREASQVPHINGPSARGRTTVDLGAHDPEIVATPHAARRLRVNDPVGHS
jgi:hypothetical protein